MRLICSVPEAKEALHSGQLTVNSASQAQTFFKKTELMLDKQEAPESLKGRSTGECERILTELDPNATTLVQKTFCPLPGDRAALTVVHSPELLAKLEKLQILLSHPVRTQAQLLEKLAELDLEMLDPSKELKARQAPKTAFARKQLKPHSETRYIPARHRRAVFVRDQGRCQYRCPFTGRRCLSTRYLQLDQIRPFARGGLATLDNLRLMRGAHNRVRSLMADELSRETEEIP